MKYDSRVESTIKRLKEERDELAEVLCEVFDVRGCERKLHDGCVIVTSEWLERAKGVLAKVRE